MGMSTPALLPSATPKSVVKWAIGSVVLVVFALVVLQLLAERGYRPVEAIARVIPMPSRVGANGSTMSPAATSDAAPLA